MGATTGPLRLVIRSHLGQSDSEFIQMWDLGEGKRTSTLFGHRGAVTCVALSEDKIVSGSDDGGVRIWNFIPKCFASTPPNVSVANRP